MTHPTLETLAALKLTGMVKALSEQMQMPDITDLSFEERLGLLVDRELTDVFAVQDEITETVVATIEPQLYVAESERAKRKDAPSRRTSTRTAPFARLRRQPLSP